MLVFFFLSRAYTNTRVHATLLISLGLNLYTKLPKALVNLALEPIQPADFFHFLKHTNTRPSFSSLFVRYEYILSSSLMVCGWRRRHVLFQCQKADTNWAAISFSLLFSLDMILLYQQPTPTNVFAGFSFEIFFIFAGLSLLLLFFSNDFRRISKKGETFERRRSSYSRSEINDCSHELYY